MARKVSEEKEKFIKVTKKVEKEEKIDLECSLNGLKAIAEQLEGDISVEESLKLYEKAIEIAQKSVEFLSLYKGKLTELNKKAEEIGFEDGLK